MNKKTKKFLSYYKPYLGLFMADMFFALLASSISLIYPMIVRYITNEILVKYDISESAPIIMKLLFVMLALAAIEFLSTFFTAYKGHMMGAKMEYDMRNDIFEHFQKLSFSFYDNQKIGQLMTRITNDLFDVTELCHHGPEDIIISSIKFIGAFFILININLPLTLLVFSFIPLMLVFALFMRGRMRRAFKRNREKIADINAQIEDNLSGIRVVKSFANEAVEMSKFNEGNNKFIDSKRNSYLNMGIFH